MKPYLRRNMLVLAVGIGFLLLVAWFGAFISNVESQKAPTAHVQSKQVGAYTITLQVDPNPPVTTHPATLAFQIVRTGKQQLVTNAHLFVSGDMEEMNMQTTQAEAQRQSNGVYTMRLQFSMSGTWLLRVRLEVPGSPAQDTSFEVTVQ
ncbi:FixH family protein [Ktedonobacter racemifer]|uniref:YtkA-like domain-containing protein n=1 Tax=Ktedonobacter racemifer DSM 44963 TaxID=485913 RepID=D6TGL0_KTERA|nr:FixH family protein [Ktedonobacter racemifer]EFH90722.1 hypothetical protein Krac_12355 [Ktedonobacter racemifer DSM 44963]